MKTWGLTIEIRQPKSRMELRRERRWRIAENVLNVLLGAASVGLAFWGGWLVGSGAIGI